MPRPLLLAAALALHVATGWAQGPATAASAALQRGDFVGASLAYEDAARTAPSMAGEYLLSAAEAAMAGNDAPRAERLLSRIPPGSLETLQLVRLQLVRSEILLARNRPSEALAGLPADPSRTAALAPRVEMLRARALFRLGDTPAAVRTLVQRERLLGSNAAAMAENRDAIWAGLTATPLASDASQRFAAEDSMTRGWLELGWLLQQRGGARFDEWQRRFPGHPGAARIGGVQQINPNYASAAPAYTAAPGRAYALLLPLSGPHAASAEVVRDGFMSAWLAAAGDKPAIRIYDAGASAEAAVSAYHTALRDGAALIVGPLRKEGVAAIAALGPPPVPVLALNYLDANAAPANLLQFGLAPEDEARAAAERAWADGRRRAATLTPASDWGERALIAFNTRLQELGGASVAAARYGGGDSDFSPAVKALMSLEASESRHKALTAILGSNTEFEPRRREDLDFIFVAARASDARLILPQLRFHRAGALPVYSTSLIYDGDGSDLSGPRFCDMPWMIEPQGAWAQPRAEALELFPARMREAPRLFAFGADAARLARLIERGELRAGSDVAGATGTLSLRGDGSVLRRLGCAQLVDGQALPMASAGVAP